MKPRVLSTTRLAFPLASAITALLASTSLHAAVLTWDNGATTGNWNTNDLNWSGTEAWNNETPDDAVFGATGVGTVTLTQPISAGSITINTAGYTITGSTLTLSGGATALTSNAASAVNSNLTLATAAGTITSSAGTLTLGGTVDAGSLALTFAGAGNTTLSSGIANATTLTKNGGGTLTLGGTNTHAGTTSIAGGILQAGSTTGLSPNSDISLASGTRLVLGGFSNTIGLLNGTGGVVENANASPVTLTLGNTNTNGSYTSNLQDGAGGGALSVIKTGSGAQAIQNATFTGGLTINQGTWQLGGVNGLGNGSVVMAAGATLSSNSNAARALTNVLNTIAVNGSITLGDAVNTGQMTLPGAVTLSSSPTITVAGGTQILSGVVSGTTFTKAGPGRLNLTSASNDYADGTTLSAGTLGALVDANLGAAGTGITVTGSATVVLGSVTYARGITLNNAAILSFDGSNPIISGNVTGTGGVSNLSGFGNQVTLSGTGNTFEGPVTIGSTGVTGQAYRMTLASLADSATANGKITFRASAVSHANGSVFEYNSSTVPLVLANRQIEFTSTLSAPTNGHQIRANGTGTNTFTINTDLIVSSPYAQTLALRGTNTGANTFAGKIGDNPSAAAGTTPLAVAFSATATSTITLNSVQGVTIGASISGTGIAPDTTITAINPTTRVVTLSAPTTVAGAVNQIMTVSGVLNPISLTKVDAGTWTLSGNNSYTGPTRINGGTLVITGATQSTNAITFSGGGILGLGIATPVTAASATVDFTGQSVLVTGSPTLASHTLLTASSIAGGTAPALASPISGYTLQVFGNELRLVQSGGSTGYALWASVNATSGGPNDDFDGDGVSNAVEFVLGGDKNTNDLGKLPAATTGSGNLVFTFVRDQASIHPSAAVTIEVGTTLASWPDTFTVGADTAGSSAGVGVAKDSPSVGKDTVTLTVVQAPDAKKFARLKVVIAP